MGRAARRRLALVAVVASLGGACVTPERRASRPGFDATPSRVAADGARPSGIAPAPQVERHPAPDPEAQGHIVVCGQRFPVDAPVVLWTDRGGYDGTRAHEGYERGRRTRDAPRRSLVRPDERDPARVADVVDQFVLHYDACGLSRTCFEVLRRRNLSVHFLLDLDGTIYQTLDLRDTAWHAREANPRSIGVEIANLGARPPGQLSELDEWYRREGGETLLVLPARVGDGGLRRSGFRARPARSRPVVGRVQGERLAMYDLTPEQYDSLVALTVALCRVFPRIDAEVPRDARGSVRAEVLDPGELARFHGILGHYHVSGDKVDPGPAFDWEGYLLRVRRELVARP